MDYSWFKALHLIFVVTYFAGLFYIFRLFVYHVDQRDNPGQRRTFEVMEKKLMLVIMNPSLMLLLVFGLGMLWQNPGLLDRSWFIVKLIMLVPLMLYHGFADYVRRRFAQDNYFLSERACRLINEVPSIVLVVVVILAVVKPWD